MDYIIRVLISLQTNNHLMCGCVGASCSLVPELLQWARLWSRHKQSVLCVRVYVGRAMVGGYRTLEMGPAFVTPQEICVVCACVCGTRMGGGYFSLTRVSGNPVGCMSVLGV